MQRRIKKKAIYVLIAVIALLLIITLSVVMIVKYNKKIHSTSYKLEKLGYTKEEALELITITDTNNEKIPTIEDILNQEYHKDLPSFLKEKYFIKENLDRYLKYKEEHPDINDTEIVSLINVNRDYDYYTNIQKTNTEQGNQMLVNKYYALDKDFVFDDLVDVSIQHCYGKQKMRKEVYDQFKKMFNDAKRQDLTIIINSSYRDYDYQDGLWNRYASAHDEAWADSYAARAGHSEHQTGLTMDVTTYGVKEQEDFENTEEFAWMQENAHKYGFILRYPKAQENITGYSYESWHYRYVGIAIATQIHEEGITFDEYYAYYLK